MPPFSGRLRDAHRGAAGHGTLGVGAGMEEAQLTSESRMRVFDRYSIAACALVILALPCSVEAQRGDCSYTRCSLRVEGGLLVCGPNEVVGRTTLTDMPSLASLVGAADSAQYYARQFESYRKLIPASAAPLTPRPATNERSGASMRSRAMPSPRPSSAPLATASHRLRGYTRIARRSKRSAEPCGGTTPGWRARRCVRVALVRVRKSDMNGRRAGDGP